MTRKILVQVSESLLLPDQWQAFRSGDLVSYLCHARMIMEIIVHKSDEVNATSKVPVFLARIDPLNFFPGLGIAALGKRVSAPEVFFIKPPAIKHSPFSMLSYFFGMFV